MFLALVSLLCTVPDPAARKTENVVIVLVDGLRWQEVFAGAEHDLLSKEPGGIDKLEPALDKYWREDAEERREILLPFLWRVVREHGQIFGNRELGSAMRVTNELKFSYPGYSEMLVGFHDARIASNDKFENPNPTVLEWLHARPGLGGRVAAFAAWDVVAWIVRRDRCGFPVAAGFESASDLVPSARMQLLDALKREQPRLWDSMPFDAVAFHTAREYLVRRAPRVLYFAFGEVDEWAHAGAYDKYLDAIQRTDAHLSDLWSTLESLPSHRGRTTVIVAPDHGRGVGADWSRHGRDIDLAEQTWLAVFGPDTAPLGERTEVPELTLGQIAATAAALLGEDYRGAEPRAAAPIADVLAKP